MIRLATIRIAALAALSVGPAAAPATGQERPPAGAETGGARLVRSTSGTRGVPQGTRYVIEDPRTVFSPDKDRQVVVYFEWEARPGAHHCEARWKDPTGKVVLASPIDYQATVRRFGIYWSMALPETAARGLWAVETIVDGQPAGTHAFEVGTGAAAAAAPVRPILSSAEIYKRALSAMATIEALGSAGEILAQGPALAFDGDHVIVGFSVIESASTLRVRTPAGRLLETQEVAGWNRRLGWAIVPAPSHGLTVLPRSNDSVTIGDGVLVVHTGEDGSRVITEAAIVGQEQGASARLRLSGPVATGSPLLDQRGDLVGLAFGGSEESLGPAMMLTGYGSYGTTRIPSGSLMVPAPRLPAAAAAPITLADLARRGEFMAPLSVGRRHVISGVFAGRVERGGVVPIPLDQRSVFSRKEGQASVFVQWDPKEKKDALSWFEVYDADYKRIGRGDGTKVKMRPGTLFFTTWTLNIAALPPAVYRLDLLLDDAPVWRGYLRVTE
jgi:hypothetical protein